MHLTLNTGMPVRRAIALSLRSTQNAFYIRQIPAIDAEIAAGHSLYEAFYRTGAYPASFLDTWPSVKRAAKPWKRWSGWRPNTWSRPARR